MVLLSGDPAGFRTDPSGADAVRMTRREERTRMMDEENGERAPAGAGTEEPEEVKESIEELEEIGVRLQ